MVEAAAAGRPRIEVVAYGRPATQALAARIAEARSRHPLDPVTVVVAANLAGLSARRLLGAGALGGRGVANVAFVTPFRLAELLGAGHVGGRRPLTTPVLAAAVRHVLARRPGVLAPVADHEATAAALVTTYAELSRAVPATLDRIAAGGRRGAEVVRLVGAVRERLAGYYDEDALAAAAAARLAADPVAARPLGAVVWHLPHRVSPAVAALLGHVLRAAPSSVVVGRTGDADADEVVLRALAGAGIALGCGAPAPAPPVGSRILSASDPDEEVRAAVREVVALADAGTPLDRIGIFHPPVDPYGRTLLEQLDGAGLPHNGPASSRLGDTVAGRTLLAALALPDRDWGRGDVIALLAGAPVQHGEGPAPAGGWDARSRQAGVVGTLDDWRRKLADHVVALRATADEAPGAADRPGDDGEAAAARAERARDAAASADALRDFVEGLAAALDEVAAGPSWAARGEAARRLLVRLLGPDHRRDGWPRHEADAAGRVEAALGRLATLDAVEPDPSAAAFVAAVHAELDVPAGRVGRFGRGVLVAPLTAAVGLDLDAVVVVGLAEGSCPTFRADDALVPDADRRSAVAGELVTRQQRLHDQHHSFLAALAAGGTHRTLVLPRGDLRGRRARLASRWLAPTATALVGRPVRSSEIGGLDAPGIRPLASFAAGVAAAHAHGTVVERDVAALLAHVAAGRPLDDHPLVAAGGALARGLAARAARAGAAFTEWDGNLAGHTIPSPATGIPVSASRLERWATCGFRSLLGDVLRVGDRDDPERIDDLAAVDRGSLVHEVLERFIRDAIERPGGPPAPSECWSAADRRRLHAIAAEVFARYEASGRVGRALSWRRQQEQILHDLDAFLAHDDAFRASYGVRPVGVEVRFGLEGEPPLELDLPDGRRLRFRGLIDRVDRADDGRLVVHDYKTGSDRYAELDRDPVLAGTTLQLGIYGEAAAARFGATSVDARYWMASAKGRFQRPGYEWTDERRRRFLDVVGAVVDGIESGTFPARSGDYDPFWGRHANCGFCEFDAVCPRDRDDHERAKAGAPELAVLARLAPPAPGGDAAGGDAAGGDEGCGVGAGGAA